MEDVAERPLEVLPRADDAAPTFSPGAFRVVDLVARLGAPRLLAGLAFPVLVTDPCALERLHLATVHPLIPRRVGPGPLSPTALDEVGRVTVGRGRESSVTIDDATVSRRHATFATRRDGTLALLDEGSLNGTFLDGLRLSPGEWRAVDPGLASVRFGLSARYVLMDEARLRDYLTAVSRARGTVRLFRSA